MGKRSGMLIEKLQEGLVTRPMSLLIFRHLSLAHSRPVFGPFLGEKQFAIDQSVSVPGDISEKQAHLAVFDLTQATAPLPRDAH